MEVTIEAVTPVELMEEACQFTTGKPGKPGLYKMYRAEHSPIRTLMFVVRMYEIPTYVSVHFRTHHVGVEHFVKSNRGNKDKVIDRYTPVNHMMFLNAQALINLARKRLCHKADKVTRAVMEEIQKEMEPVDAELSCHLVPECEYRGGCPEITPCYV